MKRLSILCFVLVAASVASADPEEKVKATRLDALKALAGTWEMMGEGGKPVVGVR